MDFLKKAIASFTKGLIHSLIEKLAVTVIEDEFKASCYTFAMRTVLMLPACLIKSNKIPASGTLSESGFKCRPPLPKFPSRPPSKSSVILGQKTLPRPLTEVMKSYLNGGRPTSKCK